MNKEIEKTVRDFYLTESNSDNQEVALMITIPKTIKWNDYLKEIMAVRDGRQEMNYKVSSRPTRIKVGDKCFIVHDGLVKGWMRISSIEKKSFQCTTTGKEWSEAWYVGRSGEFHPCTREITQKGFMGYKYVNPQNYI